MKFGITGHQHLSDDSDWDWVQSQFYTVLKHHNASLIGVSSLAIGADQYFARTVLKLGGILEVVIPFEGYEYEFDEKHLSEYLLLLKRASVVEVLSGSKSDEEAFFQAGKFVVDTIDLLIAVWDGRPSAGLGGTADVVRYAVEHHKPVLHLNPLNHSITTY